MTVDYFNHQYDQALEAFSELRESAATSSRWGMSRGTNHYEWSAALFLYISALTTYDPQATFNFLTEREVYFIIDQIRTLIGLTDNDAIS